MKIFKLILSCILIMVCILNNKNFIIIRIDGMIEIDILVCLYFIKEFYLIDFVLNLLIELKSIMKGVLNLNVYKGFDKERFVFIKEGDIVFLFSYLKDFI